MGKLADFSEVESACLIREVRFAATGGEPACPRCHSRRITEFRTRPTFRCRDCTFDFRVTTGTVWAYSNLPSKLILRLIASFALAKAGMSAEEVAALEGLTPDTAWLLLHKLREAMALDSFGKVLCGEVEVDGAIFGRYRRKENLKIHRPTRKDKIVYPREKVLCAARERGGRVLTQICKREADFIAFIEERVDRSALVYSDEAPHWQQLGNTFAVRRINHQICYANGSVHTNWVERFFSRCRMAERGVYINMAGRNFDLYAQELAFKETHCKLSPTEMFLLVLSLSLKHPASRRFKGFWQRERGTAQ